MPESDDERPADPTLSPNRPTKQDDRWRRWLPAGTQLWAMFRVNAAPYRLGSLGRAFVQRQDLKARGCYLSDRVLLGVGDAEVGAHQVLPGFRLGRRMATWPRADLTVEPALPVDAPDVWDVAVRLVLRGSHADGTTTRRAVAELRPPPNDLRAAELLDAIAGSGVWARRPSP